MPITVDLESLRKLASKVNDPMLRENLNKIAHEKGAVALISQAIADNFDREGPGWPALKFREGRALQRTGLLKKSATTVGAKGNIYKVEGTDIVWGTNLKYAGIHNTGGTVTARNAKALFIPISAKGMSVGPIKDPAARKGRNKLVVGTDMIFKKSVTIPKREFLVIRPEWRERIEQWTLGMVAKYLKQAWGDFT